MYIVSVRTKSWDRRDGDGLPEAYDHVFAFDNKDHAENSFEYWRAKEDTIFAVLSLPLKSTNPDHLGL